MLTEETGAARYRERHHYTITFAELVHVAPGLFHNTHELVPHDHVFHLGEEPVVDVEVRAADRGGGHAQNNILRIFYFRVSDTVYFNATWPVINDCFHLL